MSDRQDTYDTSNVDTLASWIAASRYMVVLTGAGMSTESGIPDFQSQRQTWTKHDPLAVSHIQTLENEYDTFHEFYSCRMQELQKMRPNDGHDILARWQQNGIVKFLATQNIENLHQSAGSVDVAQIHGGLDSVHCKSCSAPASIESFIKKEQCAACGSHLRPKIVLFGEALPQDVWNRTFQEIEKSDLLLIIGTSLQVAPANQLPKTAKGKVAVLNLDETPFDHSFDLIIRGKAVEILKELDGKLQE